MLKLHQYMKNLSQNLSLSLKVKSIKTVEEVGTKIQLAVSAFFNKQNKPDPTSNYEWEYVVVDNDKMINAWCMPGGKIAVYTLVF